MTQVHNCDDCDDDGTKLMYDVKFVLDGRAETEIPSLFVEEQMQLERGSRKRSSQTGQSPSLERLLQVEFSKETFTCGRKPLIP